MNHPSNPRPSQKPAVSTDSRESRYGPIRRAIAERDTELLIDTIRQRVSISPNGCWMWTGARRGRYPFVGRGETMHYVHRLVAWASADMPGEIRDFAHVGHRCGVSLCVAPEHLAPVTEWENVMEARVRRAFRERIDALENALCGYAPDHPLLQVPRSDAEALPVPSVTFESPRERLRRMERRTQLDYEQEQRRIQRFQQVLAVRADKANGAKEADALKRAGLSRRTFQEWEARYDRYVTEQAA